MEKRMGNFAMIDLSRKSRFSAAIAVALLAATASAQTTPPTPTTNPCPATVPPVVQSFAVEQVLTVSHILATGQPTLPPSVVAGISTPPPARDIRQCVTHD